MNTETQNYKIIVAYDGTRYKGWQVQKSTDDTIQGKLQHVLSTLAGKPVEVIGSGRTDAGVHAVGQVASFHMPKHFSKDEIFIWLNEHLPADIAVTDISNVPDRFHARYNAVSKTYVYTIHTGIVSDVFRRKYVYDYDKPLDTDRMKKQQRIFSESMILKLLWQQTYEKVNDQDNFSIDIEKQAMILLSATPEMDFYRI